MAAIVPGGPEPSRQQIQHPVDVLRGDDDLEGATERVVIGGLAHADGATPVAAVLQ